MFRCQACDVSEAEESQEEGLSEKRKMCNAHSVEKIAEYLGVPPGTLGYNKEQGFSTIVAELKRECRTAEGRGKEEFLERQWIDYAVLASKANEKQVRILFNDLNNYLQTRSYFVGHSVSVADLAVFYAIRDIMMSLSPNEKENFMNLSRWFDHLQRNDRIQQGAELVNFTTIYLHGWAIGTHL